MVTPQDLQRYHAAAKMIEVDGIEKGIRSCEAKFGKDVAFSLLVGMLRRNKGSEKQYPPRPEIDDEVNEILRGSNLLDEPYFNDTEIAAIRILADRCAKYDLEDVIGALMKSGASHLFAKEGELVQLARKLENRVPDNELRAEPPLDHQWLEKVGLAVKPHGGGGIRLEDSGLSETPVLFCWQEEETGFYYLWLGTGNTESGVWCRRVYNRKEVRTICSSFGVYLE